MMVNRLIAIPLVASVLLLGACNNEHNSNPASPLTTDYSMFVQALITSRTCETDTPYDINSLNFVFDPNQDSATPIDVSNLTPGCSG